LWIPRPNSYNDFEKTYGFVKNVQGIVPKLLQHLLNARKVAKKAMAMSTNDFDRSVQNGRQLALKVSCNSVYGFFGVTPGRGLMSCKPVAAVTDSKGPCIH
jgi:DNA polymerase delta subunit 1